MDKDGKGAWKVKTIIMLRWQKVIVFILVLELDSDGIMDWIVLSQNSWFEVLTLCSLEVTVFGGRNFRGN